MKTRKQASNISVKKSARSTTRKPARKSAKGGAKSIIEPCSLDGIFRPRSVAVIGASSTKLTIGRQILHNLIQGEFQGKVFPVNPHADVIHSIKAYPSVLDIPDPVDLALVIVPREHVAKVVEECGKKGVKGVVVISAGFKEAGAKGREMEQKVLAIVRKYGMRMIGPNCFGIVNTEPGVNLNGTFGKTFPKRGNVAFVSQSGALGEAIMVHAQEAHLGFSMFASIGNKADISGNDLLEYWANDPGTEIILMYIENFGNPRRFIKIARELSRTKPIVVVKSGRTAQGAKAASSHTGALAGLDVGADAFFEQTGVIRVDTVEQLFDVASALSHQPIPKGPRVMIATNAGGPAILATDSLISHGLETPQLSDATKKKLRAKLPPEVNFSNPLDLIAGAGPKEFESALKILKSDRRYDAIVPIFVPPITVDPSEVSQAITDGVKGGNKTVLSCFMGVRSGSEGVNVLKENGLPVYRFPDAIAKTLERLVWYNNWLERPRGSIHIHEVNSAKVRKIIKKAESKGQREIVGAEALEIVAAYGIDVAEYHEAASVTDVVSLADKLGYPLVMKINTPRILHKTDVGGVAVDLRTADEVRSAYESMEKKVARHSSDEDFSVVLQKMIRGGVETVMGMTMDPTYGPLIMFGLGGVFVEVMKDVSFRVCPVSDVTAERMIESIKSYPLLAGFRGSKPVDKQALMSGLMRLSQIVNDFDDFSEIDINPFIASSRKGESCVVDARFLLRDKGETK